MKILVTGGSGFKGSVLIPKLLKDGHQITSVDTNWFGEKCKKHFTRSSNLKISTNTIQIFGHPQRKHFANVWDDECSCRKR